MAQMNYPQVAWRHLTATEQLISLHAVLPEGMHSAVGESMAAVGVLPWERYV